MSNSTKLTEDVEILRSKFHAKLLQKRGIHFHQDTLIQMTRNMNDNSIQDFYHQKSLLERILSFIKISN